MACLLDAAGRCRRWRGHGGLGLHAGGGNREEPALRLLRFDLVDGAPSPGSRSGELLMGQRDESSRLMVESDLLEGVPPAYPQPRNRRIPAGTGAPEGVTTIGNGIVIKGER